jgi:SAM-dependent methyltransferase
MAITRHLAHFILKEHVFRPITGSTLLLGRQMVFMTPDEALAVVEGAGVKIRSNVSIEYDRSEIGRTRKFISDTCFFSLFSDSDVIACDVSDYEQADVIFDLSATLPAGMENRFDFIYNGSVLDNVFDPAACVRNVTRMLKPSGVVMHYEGAAHSQPAYFKFTTDWFFDYYALNGFVDVQTYLCLHADFHQSSWRIIGWEPLYQAEGATQLTWPFAIGSDATVVAIAERGPDATVERSPIQALYRSDHGDGMSALARYLRSRRRAVNQGDAAPAGTVTPLPGGHRELGSIG